MNKFNNLNKKAFTLAEVLITLGIIGVVAALTLPSLISNYQKTQYVVGLKKAYSELSQVFKLYMADEGVTDLSQTALFSSENYDDSTYIKLSPILKKYFKVTLLCDDFVNYDYKICRLDESDVNVQNGGSSRLHFVNNGYGASVIYTADGMAFEFYLDEAFDDCKPDYKNPSNMKGECIAVGVDINGKNPPNVSGRDYFLFNIGPDGNAYPYDSREYAQWHQYVNTGSIDGWEDNHYWAQSSWNMYACDTEADFTYSWDCAARIRDEGWKMTY